jgi:AraC-like DNA-binding protein/mannose-6-phosphate isomerase-like protein (cupin superfamily)
MYSFDGAFNFPYFRVDKELYAMVQEKKSNIPLYDYHPEMDELHSFKYFKLGICKDKDYVTTESHRHGYYKVFYFAEGNGQHIIDFNEYPIKSQSLHFVSPGQMHLLNSMGHTQGDVLLFSEEFFYFDSITRDFLKKIHFLEVGSAQRALRLNTEFASEVEKLFDAIRDEYQSNDVNREAIIRSYINILLLKCKTQFASQEDKTIRQTAGTHLVVQFKQLINKHFQETHRVSDYAEFLSVTPNHLNDMVKKALGQTAGDLIQQRILLEAQRLLLYSTTTAKEIAYSLGFNDPAYFSRFFKQHTAYTPDEFRARLRGEYGLLIRD